ncbi:MAG: MBL fold metallo-hydrolase [Spirochaetes bacterium]|jgi:glyoxylase-like metal-dependent hydrolase (beta-lactamase superfamily II)|nr:MBL fold metallo-hydrolase [Spirochaetota bacterium]
MNICREHDFGLVKAWEFGFGPVWKPLMTVYMYLLDDILIDTAQANMRRHVMKVLDGRRPGRILLTHHHEDHSGNAGAISRVRGINVFGHSVTVEKMKGDLRILPYQRILWGRAERTDVVPIEGRIDGERHSLVPIHTPGHSRDHLAFHEKNKGWLFSGDLYLSGKIKYFRADENLSDTINSLEKVLGLDFDILYCAHNPRLGKGKDGIREKLEFLRQVEGRVRDLMLKGMEDREIINLALEKEVSMIKAFTCGNVSFENMLKSAIRG